MKHKFWSILKFGVLSFGYVFYVSMFSFLFVSISYPILMFDTLFWSTWRNEDNVTIGFLIYAVWHGACGAITSFQYVHPFSSNTIIPIDVFSKMLNSNIHNLKFMNVLNCYGHAHTIRSMTFRFASKNWHDGIFFDF